MDTHFNESANQNAPISFFAQLLKYLPQDWIRQEDIRISPKSNARKFSLWDQIVSLLFCHLAGCDSLRPVFSSTIFAKNPRKPDGTSYRAFLICLKLL